jgi:hypothetical protein
MDDADKRALIAALQADIARSVAVLTHAAEDARAAATHEEARPENDKDTRAVEAAYLAGAQADRARELGRAAATLGSLQLRRFAPGEAISSTALVELTHEGKASWYFLSPEGGGTRVTLGDTAVQVISPRSALGRELLGKSEGDEVEVAIQGAMRGYAIGRVR